MNPFSVSVIIPCYNEQETIGLVLSAIFHQEYPHSLMEVVIADANSEDKTRDVIRNFADEHPSLSIRVLDNPQRSIPAALNKAIRLSRGDIVIRLDAHSIPYPGYVRNCVESHRKGRGDNIGGVWDIQPGAQTWVAESISLAAAHPLGAGDARYRLSSGEGAVDTVPFGSFKRSLFERIGYFDETLLTNEDYEFNVRVRESGGVVWLDPSIQCIYFSRSTFGDLARQYWRYGFWKWRMLRRYPHTLRWRQALPPLFMLSLVVLIVLSLWFAPALLALMAEVSSYCLVLCLAGLVQAVKKRRLHLFWGMPIALLIMHFAWSAGFVWSGISSLMIRNG